MNFPSSIIKKLRCMYFEIAEIPLLSNHENWECGDMDWDPLWKEESKKKREARVSFTTKQISILESHYEVNHFPKAALREEIGDELGLTAKKVEVWFKNRRAKAKRDGVLKTVKQVKLKFLVIFLRENLSPISWNAGHKFGRESTESPKWE